MNRTIMESGTTSAEALEKLLLGLEPGLFILSRRTAAERAVSAKAYGDTVDAALAQVRKGVPAGAVGVTETVVHEPQSRDVEVQGFGQAEGEAAAKAKAGKAERVEKVELAEKGKRGFFGIGRKPDTFKARLFHQAKVKIVYRVPASATADVTDDRDAAGRKFLELAEKGDIEAVEAFIEQGVDLNARNERGAHALMLSAFGGHTRIAELLVDNGADVGLTDQGGFNALMLACECATASLRLVRRLVEAGADVNALSGRKSTALMAAAKIGHPAIVEYLVSAGADLDARNDDHNITALIWAANGGHLPIVRFLLSKGADKGVMTHNGYSAASIAAENGHFDIVQLLK
jgi:ankyrin repeat protein